MTVELSLAHVAEDGRLHTLEDHLRGTAERAATFASPFGSSGWGRLAGLWHDIGKFSTNFQKYIRLASGIDAHIEGKPGRVDHSTAGALLAIDPQGLGMVGRVLAYSIAGHHAGLANWSAADGGNAALEVRLRNQSHLHEVKSLVPDEYLNQQLPGEKLTGFDRAFWIRMIFSCVVDADFLDTEAFFDPEKAKARGGHQDLSHLLPLFERFMEKKKLSSVDTKVNQIRDQVLNQCRQRAADAPGIFSLTVPTGGGKTLSSMAFALKHAVQHGKERIIYVIPYTSIIEQTADDFRKIFGEAVLEHHSNLDVDDPGKESARSRLACENWDAPIIVTTSVQFFESLFASRTSRCRKLHSIANSVVVLDEAQLLPAEFLKPTLHALRELVKSYRTTLLITTATMPAFDPHESGDLKFDGLPDRNEIIADPEELHRDLKRITLHVPAKLNEPGTWEGLASDLANHETVLCIVSRRDDARTLWQLLPAGALHLSRLMCGEHVSQRIGEIKDRLRKGLPTRVVSTQLVEAGVDIDFPVVYRALAGLDSIAQAAGRCNREGLLDRGNVHVFVPPSQAPVGSLRQAEGIGRQLLADDVDDHLAPPRFEQFFRQFFWLQGPRLDKWQIMPDIADPNERECRYSFRSAAGKYRIIDDSAYASVVVAYGAGAELIRKLQSGPPDRMLLRKIQRYIVNLPRRLHAALLGKGLIAEVHAGIFVQQHRGLYDDNLGVLADASIVYEPDDLVC